MPSRDALSKCGGGLGRWSCSPTSRAWIESSMRFSVGLMKTGKTTPSNYLHRQLDVTNEFRGLARDAECRYSGKCVSTRRYDSRRFQSVWCSTGSSACERRIGERTAADL